MILGRFGVAGIFFAIVLSFFYSLAQGSSIEGSIFMALLVGIVVAIIWFSLERRTKRLIERALRLNEFASQNGFTYTPQDTWQFSGMIFSLGNAQQNTDIIESNHEIPFRIANYTYTSGSGKNRQTHYLSYVRVMLKRQVPHMVLDAASNNMRLFGFSLTNLPISFKKDQVLQLEGDFNKYFTLYAPKEYERDALYVFTPDLMALLIDDTSQFDVEVIDNQMFVYASAHFNLLDQATLERIFKIVNVVGAKIDDRTDYYADESVGNRSVNLVAPAGKRLKTGIPALAIIVIVIVVIYQLAMALST